MPRGLAGHVLSLYREQGDCPDLVFGRILPDRQSIEWIPFPHEQADGIGALEQILRCNRCGKCQTRRRERQRRRPP